MGRTGTSLVEVRALAVGFQSQCGSGSIPDILLHCNGCHTVFSTGAGGNKTRPSSGVRAQGACTQSDTSSHPLHILMYQTALTAVRLPACLPSKSILSL